MVGARKETKKWGDMGHVKKRFKNPTKKTSRNPGKVSGNVKNSIKRKFTALRIR